MFMAPCLTAASFTMAELAAERVCDQAPVQFERVSETVSEFNKD